ncbi:YraN family protein [Candidatus Dojkabacteria bacterium]|nr:YraN family protein [Candidatus Dojkabacteria bacterium]
MIINRDFNIHSSSLSLSWFYNKKLLGKKSENVAANYLKKYGFKVIDRNIRSRFAEIDIIARFSGSSHTIGQNIDCVDCFRPESRTLYFVEVRARIGVRNQDLIERSINCLKLYRIINLGKIYAINHGLEDLSIGILVIAITWYNPHRVNITCHEVDF